MTFEEAKALVLREGLAGENIPQDAAFIWLHFGGELSSDGMNSLLEALKTVCEGSQNETVIGRPLAAALWTLGNSSNDCLFAHEQYKRPWRDGAMEEVIDLIMAIEGVFYGLLSEGARIRT